MLELGERAAAPRPAAVPGTGERITAREVEVLRHIAAGRSNRDVAAALFIAEPTVKTHVAALLRKLGASSRTEAVATARAHGIVV